MAHECPECGQNCYCHGDWDDCCFNFEEDVMRCDHWEQCQQDDDEDTLYYESEDSQSPSKGQGGKG